MCWLKLSVLICSISISRCSSAKAVCIHQRHIPLNNSKLLNAEMKPEVALRKMPQCWATARGNSSQCSNGARDRQTTSTRHNVSECNQTLLIPMPKCGQGQNSMSQYDESNSFILEIWYSNPCMVSFIGTPQDSLFDGSCT